MVTPTRFNDERRFNNAAISTVAIDPAIERRAPRGPSKQQATKDFTERKNNESSKLSRFQNYQRDVLSAIPAPFGAPAKALSAASDAVVRSAGAWNDLAARGLSAAGRGVVSGYNAADTALDTQRGVAPAAQTPAAAPQRAVNPHPDRFFNLEAGRGGPQMAIDPQQAELGRSRNATAPGVTTQYDEDGNPTYSYGGGYNPSDRTLDPNFVGMKGNVPIYRQPDQGARAFDNTPKGQLDKATYLQGMSQAINEGEGARLRADSARNVTNVAAAKMQFQPSPQLATMGARIADALTPQGRQNQKLIAKQWRRPFEEVVSLFREMQADEYMGYMQERDSLINSEPSQFQSMQRFADGGEVFEEAMSTEAPVAAPQEQGATAGLDSGDYVIPVEALRFFGSKFFTNLIEKAENAEM